MGLETFELMDEKDGLSRLMNNKALYIKLLKSFDGKKYAQDIADIINTEDYEEIRVRAHTLKGVAANLSLKRLSEIAKSIELEAKEHRNAAHLIADLKTTTDETMEVVARYMAS